MKNCSKTNCEKCSYCISENDKKEKKDPVTERCRECGQRDLNVCNECNN